MKFSLSPRLPLVLLLAALLGGCNTFERRSQEKASTFAALTPAARDKLKHGVIELGNTPDMVYIALGEPDEKRESASAQGRRTTWIYHSYHEDYAGNVRTGVHRILLYDRAAKRYVVYYEPIYTDVYQERVEESIRVKFQDNKVVEIEQPKPPA